MSGRILGQSWEEGSLPERFTSDATGKENSYNTPELKDNGVRMWRENIERKVSCNVEGESDNNKAGVDEMKKRKVNKRKNAEKWLNN